jgi:CRP/FNR family transcriptional regulator, cyclic AMP receptor protein
MQQCDIDLVQQVFQCDTDLARAFLSQSQCSAHKNNAILHSAGQEKKWSYMLLDGLALEYIFARNGQRLVLGKYEKGALFGTLFDGEEESGAQEIVASGRVWLAGLDSLRFLHFMESYPAIAMTITRYVMRRIHTMKTRTIETAMLSATGRVYAEILRLAQLHPEHIIAPMPNISSLATYMNTARETASRALSELEKRGIAVREHDGLRIIALHRLEELIF